MRQQVRFCSSFDGTRIAYAITSEGPPLVRAPHWFSHLEHDWTNPAFQPWVEDLSRRYAYLRFDQRGCVRCPTLVAHGSRDVNVPFEEGRRVAGLIPGSRFVSLETRNHLMAPGDPAWPKLLEAIVEFYPAQRLQAGTGFPQLTAREREVLELMAQGLDNAQIAARLDLAEKTVRNNITHIFDKIRVESRATAIVLAREHGLGQRSRES